MSYKKDPNLPYRRDWENLKVGNIVFDDCISGHGTGGIAYDTGVKVVEISETEVITDDGNIWAKSGKRNSLLPPYDYYLTAFQ